MNLNWTFLNIASLNFLILIPDKTRSSSHKNTSDLSTTKNPELILKKNIIEILKNEFFPNNEELISTFETIVYPYYKDLYKITFKYLQMFILNYHKFIYNQYHGLDILLLLLKQISS